MLHETTPHFTDMAQPEPDLDALRAEVAALREAARNAGDVDSLRATLERWDALVRDIDTWSALTITHFHQDTEREDYKAARTRLDKLSAPLAELEVGVLRAFLDNPRALELARHYAPPGTPDDYLLQRWRADVATFDPAIADDYTRERELISAHTALTSAARVELDGETFNLTEAERFLSDPDRDVRQHVATLIWQWFERHTDELDRIFDELVTLRTRIANTLGHDTFTPVGYCRMSRIGYDQADVARFRDEVRREIVPLAHALRTRQAHALGLDALQHWDESIWTTERDPQPIADLEPLLDATARVFDEVHPEIGAFFHALRERGLVDLATRKAKAGGGFCIYLPRWKTPFIFGNFNGTRHGVRTIVHELGHAFQKHKSRNMPLIEQARPTLESAEIHSMSLEFLVWPFMEHIFGRDAEAWRRMHLAEALCFLPYGAAIDHFQHEVYDNPTATPDQRAAIWRELEQAYLPWRDYGGLPCPTSGRLWFRQRHVFRAPFYYIDYVLAQTCALQFWAQARTDYRDAIDRYVALCARGGTAPFDDLVRSAGLVSPFQSGCLRSVADQARAALDL